MDISALIAFFGTAAGKAVAGAAVTAASVGGLAAADVVELPLLPDQAQTEVVTEVPADGTEVSNEASEGKAGTDDDDLPEVEAEDEPDAGRQDGDVRRDGDVRQDDNAPEGVRQDGASQGIGDSVSTDAQDGGVEGHDVVAKTPAAERVPQQAGAPADAGSQADQEPGTQAPADAGSQADQEPGTQAETNRPARP